MKEIQNHIQPIKNKQLVAQIASAQNRLHDKLINLDLKSLNISEYQQRYLGEHFTNLRGVLQRYGGLLFLCLNNSHISPQNFILVDYRGGCGLISFLAAEMV